MRITAMFASAILAGCTGVWAASTNPVPPTNGLAEVPSSLESQIKTDHQAVKSDRAALDAAEEAAGLPPTFPGPKAGNSNGQPKHPTQPKPPGPPPTPAERLNRRLKHVAHEIQKVQNLLGQSTLPGPVLADAQKMLTDLQTLQSALQQALADVGGAPTSASISK